MYYNLNGELQEGDRLDVSLYNRALNYGDGVFESMKYANNRINFWEDHYFRLMASMRILRMEIPMSFSPEYIEQQVRDTINANGLANNAVRVRLLVYRKEGGLYTPAENKVDFIIRVEEAPDAAYVLNNPGLTIDLFKDYYKNTGLLSTVKTSSAIFYTVASIFRNENDLDECILLNNEKQVVEAISANIFMVKGKKVYTPPVSSGCLKGIIRKQVLELLPKMDYEVVEENFSPFELQRADELFLTNASKGIQWVGTYRKKEFLNECSKALVDKLNIKVAIG